MGVAKRLCLKISFSCCIFMLATAAHSAPVGQKIYTQGGDSPAAIACVTCHAPAGVGVAGAGFPRLAGLPKGYLVKQLEDFRSGKRINAVMQPIALALEDNESESVAIYLNTLDIDKVDIDSPPKAPTGSTAEKLVNRGDWSRNIPSCVACHGSSNTGVGESFPPLVGQSGMYIAGQLNSWRAGTRKNDPNDLMGHIAQALTDIEIKELSAYFTSLSGMATQ